MWRDDAKSIRAKIFAGCVYLCLEPDRYINCPITSADMRLSQTHRYQRSCLTMWNIILYKMQEWMCIYVYILRKMFIFLVEVIYIYSYLCFLYIYSYSWKGLWLNSNSKPQLHWGEVWQQHPWNHWQIFIGRCIVSGVLYQSDIHGSDQTPDTVISLCAWRDYSKPKSCCGVWTTLQLQNVQLQQTLFNRHLQDP